MQPLHSHNASRNPPLRRPPHTPRNAESPLPRNLRNPILGPHFSGTLLPLGNDVLGHRPLRSLATLLPLPNHRSTTGKDRRRSPHIIYLAPAFLRQILDRENCPWPPGGPPRTCFHARPIHLRPRHDDPLPHLVLVPVALGVLPPGSLCLVNLQRRNLLH